MDLDHSEKEAFASEISDRLDEFNDFLLDYEKAAGNSEILHKLFRVAHTIKGNAGFVGLHNMVRIAHVSENLLSLIRDGQIQLNKELADLLFASADLVRQILDCFIEGTPDPLSIDVEEQALKLEAATKSYTTDDTPAASDTNPDKNITTQNATDPVDPPLEFWTSTTDATQINPTVDSSEAEEQVDIAELERLGINPDLEAYHIEVQLKDSIALPGMRAYLLRSKLAKNATIKKELPPSTHYENPDFQGRFSFYVQSALDQSFLEQTIRNHEVRESSIQAIALGQLAAELRPNTDEDVSSKDHTEKQPESAARNLEDDSLASQTTAGISATTTPSPTDSSADSDNDILFESDDSEPLSPMQGAQGSIADRMEALRVPIKKVDDILNLVGELLSANSAYLALAADYRRTHGNRGLYVPLRDNSEVMGRIAAELQEEVMRVRMIPVGTVFNRFRRLVRDYQSAHTEKEIQLLITGEETEVDKKQIDNLYDPLMHLLRNAMDHGLESSAERESRNKPRQGQIHLHSYQDGNSIYIEVRDDGRGLNLPRISQKAIQSGIASPAEIESYSEEELQNLIFMPGFSTAAEVTDISGRGVGMDVVRRNIEGIGGSIQVSSSPGEGSQFLVKLPLSMAVVTALKIYVQDRLLAIPISVILETTKVEPKDISLIENTETIKLRDKYISLVRLDREMGLKEVQNSAENQDPDQRRKSQKKPVVIVQFSNSQIALMVDELIGYEDMVIKSLSKNYEDIEGIAGAALLGRGEICLILDVQRLINSILKRDQKSASVQLAPGFVPKNSPATQKVITKTTAEAPSPDSGEARKKSKLSAIQIQTIKKIVSQARKAAHQALCKLTDNFQIQMGITATRIQSMQKFEQHIKSHCHDKANCHAFYTTLTGEIDGNAVVLIEQSNILSLANMMYTEQSYDTIGMEVLSAIDELTNILSVSYTNAISSLSHIKVLPSPPHHLESFEDLFSQGLIYEKDPGASVLLIETEFSMDNQNSLLWFYLLPNQKGFQRLIGNQTS